MPIAHAVNSPSSSKVLPPEASLDIEAVADALASIAEGATTVRCRRREVRGARRQRRELYDRVLRANAPR